ncbi:MAG: hypothetical protein K1X64_07570 [Myxococcaceae bacterium]|nr:hypothetical protein [Myxococcaceae bacterium]
MVALSPSILSTAISSSNGPISNSKIDKNHWSNAASEMADYTLYLNRQSGDEVFGFIQLAAKNHEFQYRGAVDRGVPTPVRTDLPAGWLAKEDIGALRTRIDTLEAGSPLKGLTGQPTFTQVESAKAFYANPARAELGDLYERLSLALRPLEPRRVAQALPPKQQQALTEAIGGNVAQIDGILRDIDTEFTQVTEQLNVLNGNLQKTETLLSTLTPGTDEYKTVAGQLKDLLSEQAKLKTALSIFESRIAANLANRAEILNQIRNLR